MAWIILRYGPSRERRIQLDDRYLNGDTLLLNTVALRPTESLLVEPGEEISGVVVDQDRWTKIGESSRGLSIYVRDPLDGGPDA